MDYKKVSIYISYLLRHHPESLNLKVDEYGYVNVDELITKINNTKEYENLLSRDILDNIVATDSKKRYSYNKEGTKIRAVQGHSFKVNTLTKSNPPKILYHGTALKFLDSIQKSGIKKMNRNFVHLSKDIDTAKNVGLRHGKELSKTIILEIDCEHMVKDEYDFFVADNGVWCVDYIDFKYVTNIIRF